MKIYILTEQELNQKLSSLQEELEKSETDYVILASENALLRAWLRVLTAHMDCLQTYYDDFGHLYKTIYGIMTNSEKQMDIHRQKTVKGLLRKAESANRELDSIFERTKQLVCELRSSINLADDEDELQA